jgi:hypothetical protein
MLKNVLEASQTGKTVHSDVINPDIKVIHLVKNESEDTILFIETPKRINTPGI